LGKSPRPRLLSLVLNVPAEPPLERLLLSLGQPPIPGATLPQEQHAPTRREVESHNMDKGDLGDGVDIR